MNFLQEEFRDKKLIEFTKSFTFTFKYQRIQTSSLKCNIETNILIKINMFINFQLINFKILPSF